MSYRQSTYDPRQVPPAGGRPMRPFNWVQWTGVTMIAAGMVLSTAFLLGEAGLIPFHPQHAASVPMFQLPFIGTLLINSRRAPASDPAPELAPARRRSLILVGTACALVLAVAAIVSIVKGA